MKESVDCNDVLRETIMKVIACHKNDKLKEIGNINKMPFSSVVMRRQT